MSTTVIVLIVIGLIFIFVSFALSEKLSEEKEESAGVVKIPKELTQEQKEKIDTLITQQKENTLRLNIVPSCLTRKFLLSCSLPTYLNM